MQFLNRTVLILVLICSITVLLIMFINTSQFNNNVYKVSLPQVRSTATTEDLLRLGISCPGPPFSSRVITYSLFGNMSDGTTWKRFYKPMQANLELIRKYYPGWEVRIYHNTSLHNFLGDFALRYCNVLELPVLSTNVSLNLNWMNPRVWRFLVMLDPEVNAYISRDTDYLILQREVSAVNEWLLSNKSFHIMRDHPQHYARILAGTWGGKLKERRSDIIEASIKMFRESTDMRKETDQELLQRHFWPLARTDSVIHDSYLCQHHELIDKGEVRPFPTQRENFTFVGGLDPMDKKEKCPAPCRPVDHQDWLYC